MISVTVTGAKELIQDFRDLPEEFERKTILKMADIAFKSASKGADRHTKTGALRQSLYNRAYGTGGGRAVGHDPQRAPQALWVNFGTRPHRIVPNKKKALRWPVAGGAGGFAFAKWVDHPGYRGDPYILKAKDDALAQFKNIVSKSFTESI